jgi:ABC-2 type transport system ATP-binding protein
LSEIEAACNRVVIIRRGEVLFSGRLAELLNEAATHVEVASERADDLPRLAERYRSSGWQAHPGSSHLTVEAPRHAAAELNRLAAEAGITLTVLTPREETLEDVFLRMTAVAPAGDPRSRSQQPARQRFGLARRGSESESAVL